MTATRHIAVFGFLALCLVVGAATLGLLAVSSPDDPANATVDTFEPRVAVGNESGAALSGSDGVVTCNDRGPMPGNAALEGRLEFSRPAGDEGPRDASFRAVVTVGDGAITDSHNVTLPPGESTRFFAWAVVDQPDSLSGGDQVSVRIRITTDGEVVAEATRTVAVTERDVPCADGGDG